MIKKILSREYVTQERTGFAVTFEIILTMLLIAAVSSCTIYFVQVMELERFFADVTASTCTMAARYGGSDSIAYRIQVSERVDVPNGTGIDQATIQENANRQMKYVSSKSKSYYSADLLVPSEAGGGDYIYVSPMVDANNYVHVNLKYKIGGCSWGSIINLIAGPTTVEQSFDMPSLMQRGKLTDNSLN